jgi:hypothetical protein
VRCEEVRIFFCETAFIEKRSVLLIESSFFMIYPSSRDNLAHGFEKGAVCG